MTDEGYEFPWFRAIALMAACSFVGLLGYRLFFDNPWAGGARLLASDGSSAPAAVHQTENQETRQTQRVRQVAQFLEKNPFPSRPPSVVSRIAGFATGGVGQRVNPLAATGADLSLKQWITRKTSALDQSFEGQAAQRADLEIMKKQGDSVLDEIVRSFDRATTEERIALLDCVGQLGSESEALLQRSKEILAAEGRRKLPNTSPREGEGTDDPTSTLIQVIDRYFQLEGESAKRRGFLDDLKSAHRDHERAVQLIDSRFSAI